MIGGFPDKQRRSKMNIQIRCDRAMRAEVLRQSPHPTVRSWRFVPGTVDGKRGKMRIKVPVRFRLE